MKQLLCSSLYLIFSYDQIYFFIPLSLNNFTNKFFSNFEENQQYYCIMDHYDQAFYIR